MSEEKTLIFISTLAAELEKSTGCGFHVWFRINPRCRHIPDKNARKVVVKCCNRYKYGGKQVVNSHEGKKEDVPKEVIPKWILQDGQKFTRKEIATFQVQKTVWARHGVCSINQFREWKGTVWSVGPKECWRRGWAASHCTSMTSGFYLRQQDFYFPVKYWGMLYD